ncbi:SagB/ThcOx family dehydrogenase [Pseudoduganella umbonata]|uniref:SagB-type dehydrogenase family enzyme n=1 Tax=Pseudoduganella umbonata TaxID=864828 RepID=A0A4P8HTB2_9BURK|nr:SagB family peptide dehydrogenase [Pseudoduganella umbonata]MBB3223064.1 SagB-type dehydrogenase family enzyme [Pseudoduganella umbonata]QCP13163.1 SagB/ThcOx family dehydrogenase [Pseudoduganella umbonata]
MPKLAWVLLPLALYGAGFCLALARGRAPSRHGLNVQLSVLLMGYLLATAGLGIFWVANQQLPVFDWHYLFGYGTLALVALHLWFNLPVVWRTLRGGGRTTARTTARTAAGPRRPLPALAIVAAAVVASAGAGYLAGALRAPAPAAVALEDDVAAVVRFHQHSSLSRTGVFGSMPGFDWGDAPPPFKRYPDAAGIALGPVAGAGTALSAALRVPAARTGAPTLAEAGTLLQLAAGITQRRGGQVLRAAPSSGGLFPSELYLLARRVEGLAPGIYHYDVAGGRLASLGALPAIDGMPSATDADAAIVLTSIFHRSGYKYRERAWRYAVADAGHLLENLRVAAHAAGLHAALSSRFDEGLLAGALGVDGVREAPLAVMELRRDGGPVPAAFAPASIPASANPAALGATSRIQQATSLRIPALRNGATIALPAPQPSAMPVARAIAERRSKRRFTAAAVPLPVLASLLADLRQPVQLSAAVRIHLVVNRVQGLRPGVYRYGPGHGLERVRSGTFAAAARSAALAQDAIGDAAVVLVLAADRRTMLAEGARGYRHAFLETGLVGERWLLGATARGLGACPVGAFYDDEAAALVGVDGRREWVLHFAALGVAAPQ